MIKKKYANQTRLRRHQRVRKKVSGTTSRPRLSVFRSQNAIYAQVIDDERHTTVVAASSRDAELATLAASPGGRTPGRAAAATAATAAQPAEAAAQPAEAAAPPRRGRGAKAGAQEEVAPATPEGQGAEEATDTLAGIAENRRVAQARLVGRLVAQRAKAAGIEKVVFDRGGYIYHGRVAALATGAREGGLDF